MDNYQPIRKDFSHSPASSDRGSQFDSRPVEARSIYVPLHPSYSAHTEAAGLLSSYVQAVVRKRWRLILFAIAGLLLGLLFTLPKKPLYLARTSLDVQSLNENFMNMRAVDPTGASGTYSAESNLQTHIKLLQSEELLARVVTRLESESNANVPNRDLFSRTLTKAGFTKIASTPRADLIAETASTVKVKPIGLTRLIEIDCQSSDPTIASEFCNTLAREYVDQDYQIRAATAQQTNTWLTRQLGDVRSNLEDKEARLLSYARDHQILFNQETDSVNQETLKEDQLELAKATADRVTKQSTDELVDSSSADSLPPVLDNGPLTGYQIKMTDLLREKAELTALYTPNHPKVLKVQAQIDELQTSINKEKANVLGRIHNELAAAKSRESQLKKGFAQQAQVVAGEVATGTQFKLLRQDVESERAIYESLMQRVREAGLVSMMRTSPVRVVDRAQPAQRPYSPNRLASGGIGLLLGGMFGIAFIFWGDRTSPRLHMPGDSRTRFNTRELGVIPSSRVDSLIRSAGGLELVTLRNERSLLAESYRATMNSILFHGRDGGRTAGVIVVASPNSGEGKTSLTCNLGIALAETKRRVVVIDGDMRRPRLHHIFDVLNDFGLSDVLADDPDLEKMPLATLVQPSGVPGLSVVASGSKAALNISTLLHGDSLERLLSRLRQEFDIVLIDSPPLLHMSDARVIGRLADGVVLVFRSGYTSLEAAASVQRMLEHDDIRVLGTVLNDFNPAGEAKYGYYKSYYAHKD